MVKIGFGAEKVIVDMSLTVKFHNVVEEFDL
jgi:hypothetical protein